MRWTSLFRSCMSFLTRLRDSRSRNLLGRSEWHSYSCSHRCHLWIHKYRLQQDLLHICLSKIKYFRNNKIFYINSPKHLSKDYLKKIGNLEPQIQKEAMWESFKKNLCTQLKAHKSHRRIVGKMYLVYSAKGFLTYYTRYRKRKNVKNRQAEIYIEIFD